jgi:hypothetical protein
MRYFFLILSLLIPLHVHAAAQPLGKKYVDMPVAEWLGLKNKQQVHSVQDLVSLNRLEMCYKQIVGVVGCMREAGTAPAWKGSKVGDLFAECTSDMGVEPPPGEEKGIGPASCDPNQGKQ